MHEGNGSEETLRERKMTDKNHNNSDNDDDKNGNNPTVYYVRKDGKKPGKLYNKENRRKQA